MHLKDGISLSRVLQKVAPCQQISHTPLWLLEGLPARKNLNKMRQDLHALRFHVISPFSFRGYNTSSHILSQQQVVCGKNNCFGPLISART